MYRQNEKLVEFWKEYYKDKSGAKVLFLLGKGFDPRMNNILKLFLENNLSRYWIVLPSISPMRKIL